VKFIVKLEVSKKVHPGTHTTST